MLSAAPWLLTGRVATFSDLPFAGFTFTTTNGFDRPVVLSYSSDPHVNCGPPPPVPGVPVPPGVALLLPDGALMEVQPATTTNTAHARPLAHREIRLLCIVFALSHSHRPTPDPTPAKLERGIV